MRGLAIVPGIGGSGPEHWQSRWEASYGGRRLAPSSWDEPDPADWQRALTALVAEDDVVVAHSLGCLAVATWLGAGGRCAGVLVVAVPDPHGPSFPAAAAGFTTSRVALSVPAVLVASTDDPYADVAYAEEVAVAWDATLVVAGARGHLNAASGLGDWPEGQALLAELRA